MNYLLPVAVLQYKVSTSTLKDRIALMSFVLILSMLSSVSFRYYKHVYDMIYDLFRCLLRVLDSISIKYES